MKLINELYTVTYDTGYRAVVVKVETSGSKKYRNKIKEEIEEKRNVKNDPIFIYHIDKEGNIIHYLIKGNLKNEDDFEKINIKSLKFQYIINDLYVS